MPRFRPFVSVSLLVVVLAATTTGFAAMQEATPVVVETEPANATPETATETASPSPASSPAITQADCDAYSEWEHVALFEQFAPLSFALNEAGLGVGAPDPAEIDLEPAVARQVAEKADTFLVAFREIMPPPIARDVSENFGATIEFLSVALRDYAGAVENGADPDQEFNALLERAATTAEENNSNAELAVVLAGCDPTPGTSAADVAIQQGRDLATAATAASQALSAADAPQVAEESNRALIAFLDAAAAGATGYADRLEAGEDYRTVTDEVTGALVPLGLSANEQLQTTLERCGISIGVDEPGAGNPALSESECEEFFSWYQATADLLADYDSLSIEAGVPSLEFGLILPGGYGSPDLTTETGDDEATPTQDTSPVASPATSPTPSPEGSPSPAATPQYTAQECADWENLYSQTYPLAGEFLLASIEAKQLVPAAETGLPPTDKLSPEAAREIASIIDDILVEGANLDVPPVTQDLYDAEVALYSALAAALRDYAAAVEGGADRDQAFNEFFFSDPEMTEVSANRYGMLNRFRETCEPRGSEEVAKNRDAALRAETAIEAQSVARVPRVAQDANDALIAALRALGAHFTEYANRIEAGEDRMAVGSELDAELLPNTLAATDAMRDLLERCGIPIGITEPDDGQPPLSNGQCKQVFRWYEETAARMTGLAAADFSFLEYGLALPGAPGSVDLDNRS